MVEIIEKKKKEKIRLPTLGELELGTVIERRKFGWIGLVIDAALIKDYQNQQRGHALLVINYSSDSEWFKISDSFAREVMEGDYKRIIGKLKKMVVE